MRYNILHNKMSTLTPNYRKRGFVMEMERRCLDTGIREYLRDKLAGMLPGIELN